MSNQYNTQTEYKYLYDEWLSELRNRNNRLNTAPDDVVWNYGRIKYPTESKQVQHPSEYAFEEEKSVGIFDEDSAIGSWLPDNVRPVFQEAVNKSLRGMYEVAKTGDVPYPLIDKKTGKPYELSMIQEGVSTILGLFASPEDIALNFASWGVGTLAAKGILSGTRKIAQKRMTDALIRSGIEGGKEVAEKEAIRAVADKFSDKHLRVLLKKGWRQKFTTKAGKEFTKEIMPALSGTVGNIKRVTADGMPLAASIASYNMVAAAIQKRIERGRRLQDGTWVDGGFSKDDIPYIMKEGASGVATGLTMGAVKNILGIKSLGKPTKKKLLYDTADFLSEGTIFGTMPQILRGQLPMMNDDGDFVWSKDGKPIKYQDRDGNLKDLTVAGGIGHSLLAIGGIRGLHTGFAGMTRFAGKKWRGRDAEIKRNKQEREMLEKMADETDVVELQRELKLQVDKKTKEINNLTRDKLEGLDESLFENINKVKTAIENNKTPNKADVERAETELSVVKEWLSKQRKKGEELPEDIKEFAKDVNTVESEIRRFKEAGWTSDEASPSQNLSSKEKEAQLEGDFDAYTQYFNDRNQEAPYKSIKDVMDRWKGDVDTALSFFDSFWKRVNPASETDKNIDRKLKEIKALVDKKTITSDEAIQEASKELPAKSIEYIDNLKNVSDIDKGIIKSLLHTSKYKSKNLTKEDKTVIQNLTGEMTTLARWLNKQKDSKGKSKGLTLRDVTQSLFDKFMKEKGGHLATATKERYARQFKALGLTIDLAGVKKTIPKDIIVLTTKEYRQNVDRSKKRLSGEGDVNISKTKTIPKYLARVIMNLKSRWGHRDKIFKVVNKDKTTVGDVELKNGEPYGVWLKEKSSKGKESLVFRFLEPSIVKDVKKLLKGKKDTDLLFSSDGKTPLSKTDLSNFHSQFISYGKEGVVGHRIRHFLVSAAKEIDKQERTNKFTEWADRFLHLHRKDKDGDLSPASKSYLLDAENVLADFKIFIEFHKKLREMKDVDFNKTQTKAEREKMWEKIVGMVSDETSKGKEKASKSKEKALSEAKARLKAVGALDIDMGLSIQDVSKGKGKIRFEFNNKNPNYSLKDKLADASLVGAEIIAQGAKTLQDFTAQMQARFGSTVNRYIKQLYEASNNILKERVSVDDSKLAKKLGIKPEQIKSDVPEVEANKIIKQIKEQKYDDTELSRKIVDKQIENIAYKKGLTDARLKDEVYDALGFYDKNNKPSSEGIKTKSDLADAVTYMRENFPDFQEPKFLELKNIVHSAEAMKKHPPKIWDENFSSLAKYELSMGVSRFIRKFGGASGKWLSRKIDDYAADYDHLMGFGDVARESARRLGLSGKQLDMMALMNRKVFSKKLTIEQEKFQNDMFNNPNSPQYKAREIINDMYTGYFDIILKRVKDKANPRDYERIKKWLTKRKVEDYFTQRITKEGSEYFQHSSEGRAFIRNAIRKQLYKDVVIKDKQYLSLHNQIKSLEKNLKDKSQAEKKLINKEIKALKLKREKRQKALMSDEKVANLQGRFIEQFTNKRPDKLIHPNLDFVRIEGIPEFIPFGKHAGKRMYEMNWDSTIGSYISNTSRFASAITHFPTFTAWHGASKKGQPRFKSQLESKIFNIYATKGNNFGEYVNKVLRNLVIGEEAPSSPRWTKTVRGFTAFTAVTGLSSFLSGVKNKMIGDVMNLATWGFGSFLKEYQSGIKWTKKGEKAWEEARRAGAFQTGSKHLSEIGLYRPVMKYMNLMQPAEDSNRASTLAMAKSWLNDAIRFKRGEKTLWLRRLGSEKWIDHKLKNVFEASKNDIDFIVKWGLDKSLIPLDTPNYDAIMKKHDYTMQYLSRKAHVATQGATSVADLPKWMNEGMKKQLSLFYRMAVSQNGNLYRNVFKPLIFKNPLPLFRLISGGLGYGTLHWQIKHALMGTERNEEHAKGSAAVRLWQTLSAVETFSLFGKAAASLDVDNSRGIIAEWTPAIIDNAVEAGILATNLYSTLFSGKYTKSAKPLGVSQSFDNYMRRTLVAYNHYSKIRDKMTNPDKTRYAQARKIIRSFEKEKNIYEGSNYTFSNPLYKALEREIMLADNTSEGMTSAAELYWVARTEMRENLLEDYDNKLSHSQVDAKAKSNIDNSIKRRIGIIPYSANSAGGRVRINQLFDSIDKEGAYIIRTAATAGKKRLDNFWRQVNKINSDNRYKYW